MSNLLARLSCKYVYSAAMHPSRPALSQITRKFSEKSEELVSASSDKKGGFAQAYDKHTTDLQEPAPKEDNRTFATLLRTSKFIDLGDPENKIVAGRIYHIVEDDLYVDFGWKFYCVVPRPVKNAESYVRNARVRLRIKHLELSTRFLGSEKDLTVLEADCQLLGLISSPAGSTREKL